MRSCVRQTTPPPKYGNPGGSTSEPHGLRVNESEVYGHHALCYLYLMRTLHEIKAAAATLPVEERSELAAWLSEAPEVWEIRRISCGERLNRSG